MPHGAGTLKILLLAHDLSDAAIARRVTMLRAGGAEVTVAGFRRSAEPMSSVAGCRAVDFGQTYNAGFVQRILSVLREVSGIRRHAALFAGADVIIARNLEMLAIAVRGRSLQRPAPILVYECLDIHRLLLRRDLIGAGLRALEGWLTRRASALITSSPAFVSEYFERLSKVRLPVRLVENKALFLEGGAAMRNLSARAPRPPWKIGWFGVIRCCKSLQILSDLVRRGGGKIEVVIRGRPATDIFRNFEKEILGLSGLQFLGPYKNPEDLKAIYREVHFVWAIDMFEEGLNSSWLLPNRLYEGGAFGAVPIAIETVETGRFLKRLGIGALVREPLGRSLDEFFNSLTPERYRALEQAVFDVPSATWIYDLNDCKELVEYLRALKSGNNG